MSISPLCYLYLVFVMLLRLFISVLRSLAGKGLTSWLSFVLFSYDFVTFSLSPGSGVVLDCIDS